MRELKFRAWDKKNKKFFEPIYEAYKGKLHDISITLSGQVIERTLQEPADMLRVDDWVLQQYTGLKDKNGKEIWEGDILKNENGYVAKVIYDEENGMFIAMENNSIPWFNRPQLKETEVIGNIYEDSHLLENENA